MEQTSAATGPVVLKVSRPADVLAAIPYLLGFHPENSIVVLVFRPPDKRVKLSLRVDLPTGDGREAAGRLADRLGELAAERGAGHVVIVGYGPRDRVTRSVDALRASLARHGVRVSEALRAEDGRYWSYLCGDPDCCPPGGRRYDVSSSEVAATATVAGCVALPDRGSLGDSIAPIDVPGEAIERSARRARAEVAALPPDRRYEAGIRAVRAAVAAARDDRPPSAAETALLVEHLTDLRVRDEAWARIVPADLAVHRALWTHVVRRCVPHLVAAPAALLAFTAWQQGDGGLANVALDRALAADPDYSMARLLVDALDAALPPDAWLRAADGGSEPPAVEAGHDDPAPLPRAG